MKQQAQETSTAQQAYQAAMADIANLIGWLECELDKTPETIQWPQVGSLHKLKDDLLEAVAFKSGHTINNLKEALEESRLDA